HRRLEPDLAERIDHGLQVGGRVLVTVPGADGENLKPLDGGRRQVPIRERSLFHVITRPPPRASARAPARPGLLPMSSEATQLPGHGKLPARRGPARRPQTARAARRSGPGSCAASRGPGTRRFPPPPRGFPFFGAWTARHPSPPPSVSAPAPS